MKGTKKASYKNKNTRKVNKGLQYQAAEVLIPSLILLAAALFVMAILFNGISSIFGIINQPEDEMSAEERVWMEAYLEAEKSKVGVIFDPISTTQDRYTEYREACDDYINQEFNSETADAKVDVSTIVNEEMYVDSQEQRSNTIEDDLEADSPLETGPIYFQDMLMLRYMNSAGLLKVVAAIEDDGNIDVVDQPGLLEEINNVTGGSGTVDKINNLEENIQENTFTSEVEYLRGLSEALQLMISASDASSTRDAESAAINYFTYEGKQTVFSSKQDIEISENSSIKTLFIEAGKSDSSKTYKDRIYTQQEITTDDTKYVVNIILKLNSNLRVFDIDLL